MGVFLSLAEASALRQRQEFLNRCPLSLEVKLKFKQTLSFVAPRHLAESHLHEKHSANTVRWPDTINRQTVSSYWGSFSIRPSIFVSSYQAKHPVIQSSVAKNVQGENNKKSNTSAFRTHDLSGTRCIFYPHASTVAHQTSKNLTWQRIDFFADFFSIHSNYACLASSCMAKHIF